MRPRPARVAPPTPGEAPLLPRAPARPLLAEPLGAPAPEPPARRPLLPRMGQRVSATQLLSFSEQLLTLLKAGLPLDRALHVALGTIEQPYFREVMQGVFLEVEKGNTLGDAFARYPAVFPRLYVNMIRAG